MSIQRCTLPLKSSSYSIFKFASTLTTNTTTSALPRHSNLRCCRHSQHYSKRPLSTATEYHPRSLDPAPPPPRNTNIPDTSIAGISPEVNNRRPPRQTGLYESSSTPNTSEKQSISLTEAEAQKSKPVTNASSSSPATDKPKRPTRLRPRKAAMTLTPSATEHLQQLLELPEPKFIRVGVKNRGCSGLAYHLEYVEKAGKFDEAVEQDGVKVLIDSKALFSIIGSEMDWVEDKLNQRFVFRNPNISEFPLSLSTSATSRCVLISYRGTMRLRRIIHGLVEGCCSIASSVSVALYTGVLETSCFMPHDDTAVHIRILVVLSHRCRSNIIPWPPISPSIHARGKIDHPNLVHHFPHHLLEIQMRLVLLHIIPPVLLAGELDHKAVRVIRLLAYKSACPVPRKLFITKTQQQQNAAWERED